MQRYNSDTISRLRCDCEGVAVAFKRGEPVCQRCLDMMDRDVEVRKQQRKGECRKKTKKHTLVKTITEMYHDGDFQGFAKPAGKGWGSEDILEQLLRKLPTRKAA